MSEDSSLSYRVSRRTYPFIWKCSLWSYCKFIRNKLSSIVHPVAFRADVAQFLRRYKANKSRADMSEKVSENVSQSWPESPLLTTSWGRINGP